MSRIKYTPQGFSYIDVNLPEIIKWGGIGICNSCGKGPFKEMKLVFILADGYCEDCFNRFLNKSSQMSKEDIEHDLKLQKDYHIKWYKCHGILKDDAE